jgi:hypothetical protein
MPWRRRAPSHCPPSSPPPSRSAAPAPALLKATMTFKSDFKVALYRMTEALSFCCPQVSWRPRPWPQQKHAVLWRAPPHPAQAAPPHHMRAVPCRAASPRAQVGEGGAQPQGGIPGTRA